MRNYDFFILPLRTESTWLVRKQEETSKNVGLGEREPIMDPRHVGYSRRGMGVCGLFDGLLG